MVIRGTVLVGLALLAAGCGGTADRAAAPTTRALAPVHAPAIPPPAAARR
jgi:hypothetical protein